MMRFLQAGLVAARRQFVAVSIVTLAAFVFASREFDIRNLPGVESDDRGFPGPFSSFLILTYVVTAIGMAFTGTRSILLTALRIRRASCLLHRTEPKHASSALAVRFGLSAIMLTALALGTPPGPLVAYCQYLGSASAASIIWTGTLSIGIALFGASAHAAWRAH